MMKTIRTFAFFTATLVMAFCANILLPASASAQGSNVGERMRERLPVIDALKVKGVVGENNLGYLSVITSVQGNDRDAVEGENADRAQVYENIASRTGVDSASVGRARAEQIARKSAAGVWLQDASGKWYRK